MNPISSEVLSCSYPTVRLCWYIPNHVNVHNIHMQDSISENTLSVCVYVFMCVWSTLDNFLVLMQCMGNSGCLPWEKRVAIEWRYPAIFLCAVFLCFHITGCEACSFDFYNRWIWWIQPNHHSRIQLTI